MSLTSQAIDDALTGTFPASDPPAWTPGMARPAPEIGRPAGRGAQHDSEQVRPAGAVATQRPGSTRTLVQAFVSLLGAGALALLVPVVILAVGTPVALVVRGLLEMARWLVGVIR